MTEDEKWRENFEPRQSSERNREGYKPYNRENNRSYNNRGGYGERSPRPYNNNRGGYNSNRGGYTGNSGYNSRPYKSYGQGGSDEQGEQRDEVSPALARLTEERPGWYEGTLDFKRVVLVPVTGKHEYRDTHFVVNCKAMSGLDCYNRMVEHLRGRVDSRSQFPSAKGKNFRFKYLGLWK